MVKRRVLIGNLIICLKSVRAPQFFRNSLVFMLSIFFLGFGEVGSPSLDGFLEQTMRRVAIPGKKLNNGSGGKGKMTHV